MLKDFYDYLVMKGYKEVTPGGNRSTAPQYVHSIEKVCHYEKISVATLADHIAQYVKEYDVGGIKEERGKESNSTVINALKRFEEFINESKETSVDEINEKVNQMLNFIDEKIKFFNDELNSISFTLEILNKTPESIVNEFALETSYLNAKYHFIQYSIEEYNILKKKLNAKIKLINSYKDDNDDNYDLSREILSCEAYLNSLTKCVAIHDERKNFE